VAFIGPILNEILRWHARPHVDDVSASAWFVRNFGAIWVRRVSAAAKRAYTPENVLKTGARAAPNAWCRLGIYEHAVMYV
jgi:hypothetical protein